MPPTLMPKCQHSGVLSLGLKLPLFHGHFRLQVSLRLVRDSLSLQRIGKVAPISSLLMENAGGARCLETQTFLNYWFLSRCARLEAGLGVKLPQLPSCRLSWLPSFGAWCSASTAGGRRAQGEGLPAALAATAQREGREWRAWAVAFRWTSKS